MPLSVARRAAVLAPESAVHRAIRYGLVAAWNLEEASGARAAAYGTNTLTDNNTVTANPWKNGANAAQCTAANSEYLSIADNTVLSTGDIDHWQAAWAYLDSKTLNCIVIDKGEAIVLGDEYLLYYGVTADRWASGIQGASVNADTLGSPATATWYFLLGYHDSVNNLVGVSVNGGAFDTATTGANPGLDTTGEFCIGSYRSGVALNFMDGRVARVAVGKSPPGGIAARRAEIRDYLYNGGAGRRWPW